MGIGVDSHYVLSKKGLMRLRNTIKKHTVELMMQV